MIEIRTYVKKHQEITKLRNVPSAKSGKSRQFWEREERMQVQNETEQIYGGVSVPYRHVTCDPL